MIKEGDGVLLKDTKENLLVIIKGLGKNLLVIEEDLTIEEENYLIKQFLENEEEFLRAGTLIRWKLENDNSITYGIDDLQLNIPMMLIIRAAITQGIITFGIEEEKKKKI